MHPLIPVLMAAALMVAGAPHHAKAQAAPAPSTRHLQLGERHLAYDDSGGAGPLLIALPGLGDRRQSYRALRPQLVAAGYRVVTLDGRGQGESSVDWPDYSARALGRDALALIDALQAGPAVILGSSYAAGAALWAAHDLPHQVRGVVLLGPVLRDLPLSLGQRLALSLGLGGPWRVAFWLAYWDSLFPLQRPADHAEARAALRAILREPGRMAVLRTMIGLSKADTEALLPRSRVPALVVMGRRDADFPDPAAEAHALSRTLRAETVLVEGVGHYPHLEQPEAMRPALLGFLARCFAR